MMKSRSSFYLLALVLLLCSCASGPDGKQGLKLTIVTANKEAISALAGNPDDPAFKGALDSASRQPVSDMQLVNDFISYYKALQPDKPITGFFYSGDAKGFDSEEALKAHLLTAIHNAEKKMDKVLKARAKSFFDIDPEQVRIEHTAAGQTIVYLPGIKDKEALKPMLYTKGGLHFWETFELEQLAGPLVQLNQLIKEEELRQRPVPAKDSTGEESLQEMVNKSQLEEANNAPLFRILQPNVNAVGEANGGPMIGMSKPGDTAAVSKMLNSESSKAIMPANIKWVWGYLPFKAPQNEMALYAIRMPPGGKAYVGDEDIASARGDYQNGKAEISLEMTPKGSISWNRLTRANIGKAIAIELNNVIYSAPNVNEAITGGRSSITGAFDQQEMDDLVKVLNAGNFPLSFKVIQTEPYQK